MDLSPNGAISYQPRVKPWDLMHNLNRGLKARFILSTAQNPAASAKVGFSLILLLHCIGCCSAPQTNTSLPYVSADGPAFEGRATIAAVLGWRTIIHKPDPDKPPIRTIDKLNPVWWFGNRDQPYPPEDYRPGEKSRLLKWRMRNPFHNFTFYVIGIADKKFKRSGCHPEAGFLANGGWNFAVARYRFCLRPFISWCHGPRGFHFYCGWRTAGNFGFKLNLE